MFRSDKLEQNDAKNASKFLAINFCSFLLYIFVVPFLKNLHIGGLTIKMFEPSIIVIFLFRPDSSYYEQYNEFFILRH